MMRMRLDTGRGSAGPAFEVECALSAAAAVAAMWGWFVYCMQHIEPERLPGPHTKSRVPVDLNPDCPPRLT